MTLISRILGFVRDMVIAHTFGATGATDAFFVAFKIPNFLRRLFAEGSFSQAFIPVLAEYKERYAREEMQKFINNTGGTLAGILFVVTLIGIITAPVIIMLFSPGFPHDGTRFELASYMLRITFPYLFFISLTAFAGSVLNTHNHFLGPSLTPIFLNLTMIVAAIWLAPLFKEPIIALAWGVFIAGIIQLLFQYPFLRYFRLVPRFKWGWADPGVKRILKLMVPALFGVSVAQIGILVDTVIASFLREGSITWLYNAERLMEFPLGVFGVALSTVVLPHLSRKHAANQQDEFMSTMNWGLQTVLLVGVPSGIVLILLANPLMVCIFNYGRFTNFDSLMSAHALMAFSIGVPFFMLVKILASGFYARQNIKTPVKIAVIALTTNVIFNFIFMVPLQHAGLALASSLAAIVNAGGLFFLLRKNKILELNSTWRSFMLQLVGANIILVGVILILSAPVTQWYSWNWHERYAHLLLILGAAGIFYFAALWLFGFRFVRKK
jgi:putative peptidoglycan lipid II flippase